jgi:hypothetical protein
MTQIWSDCQISFYHSFYKSGSSEYNVPIRTKAEHVENYRFQTLRTKSELLPGATFTSLFFWMTFSSFQSAPFHFSIFPNLSAENGWEAATKVHKLNFSKGSFE